MTPIPTSYLARDLYRRTWDEPESMPGPATLPKDGERPWWERALGRLGRALEGAPAVQRQSRAAGVR